MSDMDLLPCPWCGAGETRIEPQGQTWRGMSYSDPICYRLVHFCGGILPDDYVTNRMEMRGRTEDQCVEAWNIRADAALALVAEVYEVAAASLEDRGSDGWAENVMAEYASVNAEAIRALTPSDALAAREARDKRVRDGALREAIYRISSDARNTLNDVSEYEAGMICDTLRHMIKEGGQTDE